MIFISDRKSSQETKISKLKQTVKNEIDLKVDKLKEELEELRKELYKDVDRICNNAIRFISIKKALNQVIYK